MRRGRFRVQEFMDGVTDRPAEALAKRQQAAAQSSLTDRINLSIAEAFVNGGSLTVAEPIHPSRLAQIPVLALPAQICAGRAGCVDCCFLQLCYFVATFTPLRPLASIAFCTTPVCFASSRSAASAACAAAERPFGSAAATRTVANAPGTMFAPVRTGPRRQDTQRQSPPQTRPGRNSYQPMTTKQTSWAGSNRPLWNRLVRSSSRSEGGKRHPLFPAAPALASPSPPL